MIMVVIVVIVVVVVSKQVVSKQIALVAATHAPSRWLAAVRRYDSTEPGILEADSQHQVIGLLSPLIS